MTETQRLAYRINEAAEYVCISRSTIYRLIAAGKLKTVMIGRRRVIPASALRALVEKGASLS